MQSPTNLGSLCRTAEAFGIDELYVHEYNKPLLKIPRFLKSARHTHKFLNLKFYSDALILIDALKDKGYEIIALEYCDNSQNLGVTNFSDKSVVIIGHEKYGVEKSVLDHVHKAVHIEMYGKNSSMNVTQATSIALYHAINFRA